jgi:hypothetical protein
LFFKNYTSYNRKLENYISKEKEKLIMKKKLIGATLVTVGTAFYAAHIKLCINEANALDEKFLEAENRKEKVKAGALWVTSGARYFAGGMLAASLVEGGYFLMKN